MAALRGLTSEQRYLFDLRGFLIIRNVLSSQDVAECRNAISNNMNKFYERIGELRNSRSDAFYGKQGRFDCGTMLHWDRPHCNIFRKCLALPKLCGILSELCGPGFRLDHLPLATIQYQNCDGFDLHGGNLDQNGLWQQDISYDCRNGKISCNLVNVSFQLNETRMGDGGFVLIPGSHKANFPLPKSLGFCNEQSLQDDYLLNPAVKSGDVLIFSEAACHGALPWRGASDSRTNVFYRYCPANYAYGRGYLSNFGDIMDELTEAEKSVVQPPYANRLDRVEIVDENNNTKVVSQRSPAKKEFDKNVFDCDYF